MASSEEKTELVETLKGPRFYRIQISGYGGESAYMSISKKAYEFWHAHCEAHGTGDLENYMLNVSDDDVEYEELQEVPSEADFLLDDDYHRPWYESHTEFEHTYGASYDSSYITVEEVTDAQYNSDVIEDVIIGKELNELNDEISEETDWAVELVEMGCCDEAENIEYIAQMYSSEKGCFFDGVVETIGKFDPKKLKIYTTEYLNGEDTITEIHYDGVEIDNDGPDANGKGFYAAVWKN